MQPFRLGPFEILGRLGEGGMGTVYRARQEPLGRMVALKLLRADSLGDRQNQRRFAREIKIAAGLSHPSLVKVLDGGRVDKVGFIAMELVDGDTLSAVAQHSGAVPWMYVAAIGAQLSDGLAYLHGRGIVHRDVKTSNALLSADGQVKLVDFGLALPRGSTAITADGAILGTLTYLAPEVLRGEPSSPASDMWALGCVLYRLLTGRMPVTPLDLAASPRQPADRTIETPFQVCRDVPPPVSALVMELLRCDPAERTGACDVKSRLDRLLRRADTFARRRDSHPQTRHAR